MLIDLSQYERCAEQNLGKAMVPFVHYGCPLLHRTLDKKTFVEGIIILHDWWKTNGCNSTLSTSQKWSSSSLNEAVAYIDEVIGGTNDPSLTPLVKPGSAWVAKLLA